MKKVNTGYSSQAHSTLYGHFFLDVKVNNEYGEDILVQTDHHIWRSKEGAIAYLKWCIEQIDGLKI